MISQTEENYLKAIYQLSQKNDTPISTNAIAKQMQTAASSVTDMVKRLSSKELIHYQSHKGSTLTEKGNIIACNLIRKHRLWECFLFDTLNFTWDEVHDIAEQLEHIQSNELIDRLDRFLGYPKFDPHGDPIPDKDGNFVVREQYPLSELSEKEKGTIVGIREHTKSFLAYLEQFNLLLGQHIEVLKIFNYDQSVKIRIGEHEIHTVTQKIANNLFIKKD